MWVRIHTDTQQKKLLYTYFGAIPYTLCKNSMNDWIPLPIPIYLEKQDHICLSEKTNNNNKIGLGAISFASIRCFNKCLLVPNAEQCSRMLCGASCSHRHCEGSEAGFLPS